MLRVGPDRRACDRPVPRQAGPGGRALTAPSFDVVVATAGRPSLASLLEALAGSRGPLPEEILVVVDDRPEPGATLLASLPERIAGRTRFLAGRGAGPASARNIGWRASRAGWVAFLDDDVLPEPDWLERLADDLAAADDDVAGSQGRIRVPLPAGRRPTDWERNVKGLERARWATADLAYRRAVLERLGGFDERFPRAFREDADLGLRVTRAGYRIEAGRRSVLHPVRAPRFWEPISLQRGNTDDVLMRALHGRRWHDEAGAPRGRRGRHLLTTGALAVGAAGALLGGRRLAVLGLAAGVAGEAELAWTRLRPGPRTPGEIARVVATSLPMPFAATFWWAAGWARLPFLLSDRSRAPRPKRPDAVLLDRDGTLVVDVPYNGDPARVSPVGGAREALDRLRSAGVATAVVSNQSGIARGRLTFEQVDAVHRRIEDVLGPVGPQFVCPHGPDEGCACRKPAPGLVLEAAKALGVSPDRCAVIGDIGSDMEAAAAVGARGILVPGPATRPEEVSAAPEVAASLGEAVDLLLGETR